MNFVTAGGARWRRSLDQGCHHIHTMALDRLYPHVTDLSQEGAWGALNLDVVNPHLC